MFFWYLSHWNKVTLTYSHIIGKPYLALSSNTNALCFIFLFQIPSFTPESTWHPHTQPDQESYTDVTICLHSLPTRRLHIQRDQETYTVFTICLHSLPTRHFTFNQTRNPIQSSPFLFTHYLHNAFTSDQTRDGDHVLPAMLDYKGLLSLNTLHLW